MAHPQAQPSRLPPPTVLLDAVRRLVRRLPVEPPSFVAARLLDRLLLPRLDEAQRVALSGKALELEVLEPGLRLRLQLAADGFRPAPRGTPIQLTIRARSEGLWKLLRGEEDADRLFFDRALVMEGDTEFGLMLKNTLDAIGPLLPVRAA
ncbi:SCP2 sterol-binding domain-containing protein [Pelomonas sp. APW6]|uniref:SCP2 sterol-binding domain-containing protein n=1 Tax=Roseateles subflavus TaxID=3053353 RepID=A0ABT7LMH0_9BURK|nr:SCP2 sterol-binding domain-containing protein [Pelomonas sp. APW6]MDL5034066.1 SCP2 sterol-binding domain-containing protein [Pelomonas sp. APW6]